jgi:hypothetical protein
VPNGIPNRLSEGRELQGLIVVRPDTNRSVGCKQTTIPARVFLPTADIYETNDALNVVLEIPGVEKSSVDIRVEDGVLHPSQAFEHPSNVVNDPDLTLNEKRAILASWASDACAIEAVPTLRCLPGGKRVVHFDEVMDALRALDEEARRSRRIAGKHRVLDRSRNSPRGGTPEAGHGHPLG